MQFTLSLGIGLALGLLNWLGWSLWAKRALKRGAIQRRKIHQGFFAAAAALKLGILGGVIWFLFSQKWMEPIGFLIGFSIAVMLTLSRGLKWN